MTKISSLAAAFLLISANANGYQGNTHGALAEESYTGSKLTEVVGMFGIDVAGTYPNVFGDYVVIKDLMRFGAQFEDGCGEMESDNSECSGSDAYPNVVNPFTHFFDPQQNGKGLTLCSDEVASSPDWALEDRGQIGEQSVCGTFTVRPQRYSYADAAAAFREALTAGSPAMRRGAAGRMFQSFGHIAHHLHDMGQPQHVRDDLHCPSIWCALAFSYEPSVMEEIAQNRKIINSCILPWVHNRTSFYPNAPQFSTGPRSYWTTGDGIGMAEFTNWNFVSVDSNFVGSIADPEPERDHPLPDPDFSDGSWDTQASDIQTMLGRTCLQNGWERYRELEGELVFITRDIRDPYNEVTYPDVKISAYSIFTDDLVAKNEIMPGDEFYLPIFSVNPFVYEDNYRVLLPRAVSWVDGLINSFFRGRLEVSATPEVATVTNRSGTPISGTLSLYYDDRAGTRRLLSSTAVNLTANQSRALALTTPVPPAGFDGEYIAVFEGDIGSEYGLAARTFTPAIPCGSTVSLSGGTGTMSRTAVELGNTPGKVEMEFEAYQIPDSFKVTINGKDDVLEEAESVQGYDVYDFYHDPGSAGSTKVDVTVTGNDDPYTAWRFSMGCPGESLGDSPNALPRVSVVFGTEESSAHSCMMDLYVDGQYAVTFGPSGGGVTMQMTKGTNHFYEYRNYRDGGIGDGCTFPSQFQPEWMLYYRDSMGTHSLNSPIFSTGNQYFTVQ